LGREQSVIEKKQKLETTTQKRAILLS
jgi:hypothetical protein